MDLKILLPNREVITITARKNSNADQVYASVVDKIRMNKNTALYFYLFEIVEYNFGEFLHELALVCECLKTTFEFISQFG